MDKELKTHKNFWKQEKLENSRTTWRQNMYMFYNYLKIGTLPTTDE